jgi:hypothetical protein
MTRINLSFCQLMLWLSPLIQIAANDAFPFLPEKGFAVHQPPLLPHPTRLFVKV